MHLKDKVLIVTAGGQGVGQGIALSLAAEGTRIAVTGRTREKLQHSCRLIEQRGGAALAVVCDVKNNADLQRCWMPWLKGRINHQPRGRQRLCPYAAVKEQNLVLTRAGAC